MTPMVNNFAKCGCGRSATGLCDGSHAIPLDEWRDIMIDREFDDSGVYSVYPELPLDSDYKRNPYAQT